MPYTYVTPNATVWLLKDVPLSNDYEHTVLFERQTGESVSSAQERQKQTFVGNSQAASPFLHRTFDQQMYKRVNRETIKVDANYDDIYMCNYMVFQNYSNSPMRVGKTYYAFILEMNYKNEGTTEIVYEIDVMQTWMFDYQIMPSFVEREHSKTDRIGDNIVPEPLGTDAMVKSVSYTFTDTTTGVSIVNGEYSVVIVAPWKYDHNSSSIKDVEESFYGRMYSPLFYNAFHISGTQASVAPNWLDLILLFAGDSTAQPPLPGILTEKQKQEIVAIYILPTFFVSSPTLSPTQSTAYYYETRVPKYTNWHYTKKGTPAQGGEWVNVRNNKLFTYPYTYLYVTNSDGVEAKYRFELFQKSDVWANFGITGTPGCPPQIKLTPKNYRFAYDSGAEFVATDQYNHSESMLLNNFPLCPWVTDTFKAWLAQNAHRMLLNPLTKASTTGVWASTGHPLMATMAAVDAYQEILNSVSDTISASMMPDDSHGVSSGMVGLSDFTLGFNYQNVRVNDQTAAIIDEFFDKYGYATKRIKTPNRNVREEWCYTKTIGCLIKGVSPIGLPSGAEDKIASIYDKGVTFWKNIYHIGQYDLSNRCVAEL